MSCDGIDDPRDPGYEPERNLNLVCPNAKCASAWDSVLYSDAVLYTLTRGWELSLDSLELDINPNCPKCDTEGVEQ